MEQRLSIKDGEVHLWYTFPEEIRDQALMSRYHTMLNPEEAAQQKRFHFERHRHQYLLTRAMIRSLLSGYSGIPPESLRFEKNEYGRPELVSEQRILPLHFNLSHTDGLIVCGIVLGSEIGVDVEDVTRGGDLVKIADRFFSKMEVADLSLVQEEQQENRFFDYWTLKESYIKARGMGLSIPLGEFGFVLNDLDTSIDIEIDPVQNDKPDRWKFKQWRHGKYKIALCLENKDDSSHLVLSSRLEPLKVNCPMKVEEFRSSKCW